MSSIPTAEPFAWFVGKVRVSARSYINENAGVKLYNSFPASFLFHLLGAKDELNIYYGTNLSEDGVTPGNIRKQLQSENRKSAELAELYSLETDYNSWFSIAKAMRDASTHIQGVKRAFHLGGHLDQMVYLKHPSTLEDVTGHYVDDFEIWFKSMCSLLDRLRNSALKANGL